MSYIKKEPLLQIAKELQGKVFGAPLIVRAIEEAPDENVVEVRHGEWVRPQFCSRTGFYTVKEFHCNQCGETFNVSKGNEHMNYCPNCGAKMDGERRNNDE